MTDPSPSPTTKDTTQIINDLSDLRKYRTELPNLYDDADLDVYEFRLLSHYKRVGRCTESTSTTAKKCKMSTGMVSQSRQSLAVKGWITLEKVEIPEGFSYVINVVDRWIENFAQYSGSNIEQIKSMLDYISSSRSEATPSPHEATPSPHETKKEPIKNIDRYKAVAQKVALLTGGAMNSITADLIATWLENHEDVWIFKAIEIADANKAKSANYVDAVLIGWEANGYPKTRSEKVQGAKRNDSKPRPSSKPDAKQADPAAVAEINRRRRAKRGL